MASNPRIVIVPCGKIESRRSAASVSLQDQRRLEVAALEVVLGRRFSRSAIALRIMGSSEPEATKSTTMPDEPSTPEICDRPDRQRHPAPYTRAGYSPLSRTAARWARRAIGDQERAPSLTSLASNGRRDVPISHATMAGGCPAERPRAKMGFSVCFPLQGALEGEFACREPRGKWIQQLTVRRETFSLRTTQP